MGKLKEHFHEEISNGLAGGDQQYAITCMCKVKEAVKHFQDDAISQDMLLLRLIQLVNDFDNMHDPCQPS